MSVLGRWRIVDMELWDTEDLDLVGPAFIEFAADETGRFAFIAVEGWMDCREARRDGHAGVEFSWEGNDECDPVTGRGWAVLGNDDTLSGRIYFHRGDDSRFRAARLQDESMPETRAADSSS